MVKQVLFNSFGVQHLELVERTPEEMGPDQVRVEMKAVSLNYRDYLMVGGLYNPKLKLPLVPCSDGAGVITQVGAQVKDFKPGDRVCTTMLPGWETGSPTQDLLHSTLGGPEDGVLAEERVLSEKAVLKLPDTVGWHEGACLPVAGLTAWSSLMYGKVGAGSKVLLLGTGGVSMMALPLALQLGAEVAVTSSSNEKLERVRKMGANATVNYREKTQWAREILKTFPQGVDCVLEVGGDGTFDQSVKATCPGGVIALMGVLATQNKPVNLTAVVMKNIRVQGILVGSKAVFKQYLAFVAQHRPLVVVDRVFQGLERAGEAMEFLAAGKHFGKLVIEIES